MTMSLYSSHNFRRWMLATSIGLMLFSLSGLVWLNLRLSGKGAFRTPLPVLAQLPDFALVERSGKGLGLGDLKGTVWIADFVFTRCPGPCPRMSARMASLQRDLRTEDGIRLVSISVDPEFDTPEVLSKYASKYQAEEGRWFFLTGDKSAIHRLAKSGFLVGGVDDVTLHTTRFVLVDRHGRVRGYYSSSDAEDLQKLRNDARVLLQETGT